MGDAAVRLLLFVGVCGAAAVVHGATRASEPTGIARHAIREFAKLAGGIAALCIAIWLLLLVVQG